MRCLLARHSTRRFLFLVMKSLSPSIRCLSSHGFFCYVSLLGSHRSTPRTLIEADSNSDEESTKSMKNISTKRRNTSLRVTVRSGRTHSSSSSSSSSSATLSRNVDRQVVMVVHTSETQATESKSLYLHADDTIGYSVEKTSDTMAVVNPPSLVRSSQLPPPPPSPPTLSSSSSSECTLTLD